MGKYRSILLFLLLTLISNICFSQTVDHWETIIKADDNWKYAVPVSEPDSNWRYLAFNSDAWSDGPGGFGYGDNDDKTTLANGTVSVFLRKVFTVDDTSKIINLLLNADYDDAFVAYINGTEVARGGGLTDKHPAFSRTASYSHEAVMFSNGKPESFLIKTETLRKILNNGSNVLCIQAHNDVLTSSDLSAIIYLSAGIKDQSVLYSTTPVWFVAPVEFGFSHLPIVLLTTSGGVIFDEPKITARIAIVENASGLVNRITDTPSFESRIGIETRGSSSQQFPKKSYGFETRTDLDSNLNVSLMGMPADNDWILYAPYDDKTFLRDILAYRLGRQMGHYTPLTVVCELYLNGAYQGVYVLMEKVKQGSNRVNIAKLKTADASGNDITGGYILKIDKETGSNNDYWSSQYHPKNLTNRYINFLYDYPKPDEITSLQKNYIQSFVKQFENVLTSTYFTDPQIGYQKYIDVNSFVDYFIMNEASKNVDGFRISSYFHKDRADKSNKLVAGPLWDYNIAFGNADYYNGASNQGWFFSSTFNNDDLWQVPFWWEKFLQDPYYCNMVKERYTFFRQDILKTDNINKFIDSMALALQMPQARNYQKWPVLGTYLWPNPYIGATYQQEIDYLKKWINDRLVWMDSHLPGILILDIPGAITHIVNEIAVVYPNPFSTNLWIELFPDNRAKTASIEIFDMTGKKLFTGKSPVDNNEKTLYSLTEHMQSSSALSTGMYILKVKLDTGKEFQTKIVKK